MSTITWIIIILIVISIGVTVSEVGLRFALLEKEKGKGHVVGHQTVAVKPLMEDVVSRKDIANVRQGLSAEEVQALCGMDIVGKTFADLGYC